MPRRARAISTTGIYHVVNRGVNRQRIFFGDEGLKEFERGLALIHQRFGVSTLAYCLMSNHYHALLHDPDGHLSEAMHLAMTTFVRHTNDRIGRDGPMFRSRFWSKPVETDVYLMTAARYVHRNSLDLAPNAALTDWPWSSYSMYLGLRDCPEFVDADPILGLFGYDRSAFAQFTEHPSDALADLPLSAADVRSTVAGAVATILATRDLDDSGRRGIEQTVLTLLLDQRLTSAARAAVTAARGGSTDGATKTALSRSRRRLAEEPIIQAMIDLVMEVFGTARLPL